MDKDKNLFEEYLKTTRDLILERVSSPFIFSFVISWLITNYKIVMVTLTDQTEYYLLEYKIWLVKEYINYKDCLFYPLLGACIYTFVYPFADKVISTFTLNRKLEKRQAIQDIEKTQLKTVDEVEAIHRRHFEVELNLRNQIDQARITEEQLRSRIDQLQKDATVKKKLNEENVDPRNVDDKETQLTGNDLTVIKSIGNLIDNDKVATQKEIQTSTGLRLSEIKLALSSLVKLNYVNQYSNKISLTEQGLAFYNQKVEN